MSKRKFWGWGNENYSLPEGYLERYLPMVEGLFGVKDEDILPLPELDKIELRSSRFILPSSFDGICTTDKCERLNHTYGKSFRDIWRAINGRWDNPPDYVAFPRNEEEIAELMVFAGQHNVGLIPYGGGSSVCGGVEAPLSPDLQGVITVDMRNFDQVIEIDMKSRAARIEAGIYGPALEDKLKPHGLTLRHYPQSFEFSTLGGWIATRSGGHYATLYTHIDEFVQSIRMVTPAGVMETTRLPSHGAGPSEERFICGSEGSLGIITSAWMRLQQVPEFKVTRTVEFERFEDGVEACRLISQSGLFPSNARLIDSTEAFANGLGDGKHAVLILGFESFNHELTIWMEEALSLASHCGGKIGQTGKIRQNTNSSSSWKRSFLLAPYVRDELIRRGIIVETFETCITWQQFDSFHGEILKTASEAIEEFTDFGMITTRFTHLYPDGPAPYYTIMAKGKTGRQMEQWDDIKKKISSKIVELGGPITHHHAVGKDHLPYYEKQQSALFGEVLRSAKHTLDPSNIMNPDTLIRSS